MHRKGKFNVFKQYARNVTWECVMGTIWPYTINALFPRCFWDKVAPYWITSCHLPWSPTNHIRHLNTLTVNTNGISIKRVRFTPSGYVTFCMNIDTKYYSTHVTLTTPHLQTYKSQESSARLRYSRLLFCHWAVTDLY